MNTFSRIGSALARLAVFSCALAFTACGGIGDGSSAMPAANAPPTSSCTSDCGTVLIGMTDADGDFLSYTVDVVSLKLKRANGAVVETLPATTRIDFAQFVDLTELFTAATVPSGAYVAATLRLDFTNADISVEMGGAPVAASAVDAAGNALGVVDVNVTLDNRHHLVVARGLTSVFTLDFNLAATNSVDLTTTPVTVTVTPALVASLEHVDQKDLRVRGPLVSVDTAAGTYVIDVRPCNMRDRHYGQVTVHTDADTTFEVNGTTYTGSAGLAALSSAGAGTLTTAFGTLTKSTHQFDAQSVRAGTSVSGAGIDTVLGQVLSRSGDVLTVRGATINRNRDGARFARGTVLVTIGPETKVSKDGADAAPGDISVGQAIEAFGAATPVDSSAMSGDWTMDATAGRVRMHATPIYGFVKQSSTGAVTLQLDSIAGRRVSAFNFAGTGTSAAQDADPANYEVSTGALDLSGLSNGEPTKLVGYPTAFGAAPPDFDARTLVDYPRLPALLSMSWGIEGTKAPFTSQEPTGLVLDLANPSIGRLHFLSIGPRVLDLKSLPASPSIVPPSDERTAYLVVMRGESRSFQDFADFVAELGTRLDGDTAMVGFTATGSYDGATNVVTARSIVVLLK
ncbi:MAG TPA: hypothetical protein VEW08_17065 [Steroidobacteraceae bacterium]|nr:hypothetical protein [Steroidobacteraceae bacterium]